MVCLPVRIANKQVVNALLVLLLLLLLHFSVGRDLEQNQQGTS